MRLILTIPAMLARYLFHRNYSSSTRADGQHKFMNLLNAIQSIQRKRRNLPCNISLDASHKAYENMSIEYLASNLCQSYMKLPPFSSYRPRLDQQINVQQMITRKIELEDNRYEILRYLIAFCGPDKSGVVSLINSFHEPADEENVSLRFIQEMRAQVTPEYEMIFKLVLSEADPGLGLSFLIQIREDVRAMLKKIESNAVNPRIGNEDHKRLKALDEDLKDLLSILVRSECLELRRISLDETPEAILKQIAMNDAVHPMDTLDGLKDRLNSGRLCYALFHSSLPYVPLVILHTALLQIIPRTLKDLDNRLPQSNITPRVAAFYSITNACPGLSGLELGKYLIKGVMDILTNDYKNSLSEFVTLSPIPGFRSWLLENKSTVLKGNLFQPMNDNEKEALMTLLDWSQNGINDTTNEQIRYIKQARTILMRLAANYLCSHNSSGYPLDRVTRFHMRNGASMLSLNFLADLSPMGIANSFGIMVNYNYCFSSIGENQISYEKGLLVKHASIDDWLK